MQLQYMKVQNFTLACAKGIWICTIIVKIYSTVMHKYVFLHM